MDEIITRIRERIKEVGWSETARRCGHDRTALHRTFGTTRRTDYKSENTGPKGPSLGFLIDVARAVGLTLRLE